LSDGNTALDAVRVIKARWSEVNSFAKPIIGDAPVAAAPIRTADELIEINRLRRRGDIAAQARFDATPLETLRALQERR